MDHFGRPEADLNGRPLTRKLGRLHDDDRKSLAELLRTILGA